MTTVFSDLEKALENLKDFTEEKKQTCYIIQVGYGNPKRFEYVLRPDIEMIDRSVSIAKRVYRFPVKEKKVKPKVNISEPKIDTEVCLFAKKYKRV